MLGVTTASAAADAVLPADATLSCRQRHAPADLGALVERSRDAATAACRLAEDLLGAARERDDQIAADVLVLVLEACARAQTAMAGAVCALRDGPVETPAEAVPWTYGAAPVLADGPRSRE